MENTTKIQKPILLPQHQVRSWVRAHSDLIATTTTYQKWVFITLTTGEQIYGYSGTMDGYSVCSGQLSSELQYFPEWQAFVEQVPALHQIYLKRQAYLQS